jgi:hypothetical protein
LSGSVGRLSGSAMTAARCSTGTLFPTVDMSVSAGKPSFRRWSLCLIACKQRPLQTGGAAFFGGLRRRGSRYLKA